MPFVWRENKHSLHSFVYLSVRREQLQLLHQTSSKQDTCLKNQNWTRRCETKKLYERMAISHPPFRPFSHRDFHSKRLIPPKVLYLTCVRDKSENLKQQNPNGEFSKWWRCQERFQGHPLSDGPSPVRHAIAHLFCRLPALATWRDTYGSEQAQQRTPSSIMAELMISFNWSMKLMVVLDNSFIVSCVPSFKILLESQAFQR